MGPSRVYAMLCSFRKLHGLDKEKCMLDLHHLFQHTLVVLMYKMQYF